MPNRVELNMSNHARFSEIERMTLRYITRTKLPSIPANIATFRKYFTLSDVLGDRKINFDTNII